ncbi:MAG: sensor histidine kinase [Peptostreptococcaceae bacterium]
MYRLDKNYEDIFKKRNKSATYIIIGISIIISILFLIVLGILYNPKMYFGIDINVLIRIFSAVLSGLAISSCMLCYTSTKKEELFIISLMYIVFFIDISLGSFDYMKLKYAAIDISNYITVPTSLIRISILLILILPFNKTRKLIMDNKIKAVITVTVLTTIIGILRSKYTIFTGLQTTGQFIAYNVFLIIIYIVFTIRFGIKSVKEEEYIYAVISASIFFFAIKALYAIVSVQSPSISLKLISYSITYIGFFIFIGGLLVELALSIKKNKSLEKENQIFYTLVDDSKHSCIVIYDENHNVKFANKTLKEYLFNDGSITQTDIASEMDKYRNKIGEEILQDIYSEVGRIGAWRDNLYISEDDKTIDCFFQKIYTYNGKVNIALIFKDITDEIRAKNSIIEYEKIKSHENIKNEFFANISHELRTPLNIFYSTIQLLDLKSEENAINFKETYLNHRQCLNINCQRMLRLINNIVDITKIDVGFTKAKFSNCDIVRLVEDITLSVVNYANPKDIDIIFDTEVEEHIIKCDPSMIERAMLNLLSNAIKFTNESGNILVSMYADDKWVHIRVKDDGIGIPLEMQSIIFDRFIQSDKSLTRLNEGSGIGLSIVKSIIELNEGEIYLDSDEENGTEFEILLPNKKLEDNYEEQEYVYHVDIQKIQLELSDIYKLYE